MNILEIKDLSINFKSRSGIVHAVRNASLHVKSGELLGIVGESGCGKTTTALCIPNLLPKNAVVASGQILFEGRDLLSISEKEMQSIRWKEISVIFQGAMNALNPLRSIGDQIIEPLMIHEKGIEKSEAMRRGKEILEKVGIAPERFSGYPHEFSGGMRQRVMIAMALVCRPKLVIADEPVTALDVMIQAQILELLRDVSREYNLSLVMISHDLSVLSELCDSIAVMYAGSVLEYGNAKNVFGAPKHPYTQRLLHSYPDIYGERKFIDGIPGYPPSLYEPPGNCPFYERCDRKLAACERELPHMSEFADDSHVSCLLWQKGYRQ
jgi:peptide/nickel transport system ATP-binding protein